MIFDNDKKRLPLFFLLLLVVIFDCVSHFSFANASQCQRLQEPFTQADLTKMRVACKITSARNIRTILPDSYRINFTFAYSKDALLGQCIMPRKPRVFLFSPTNNVVISFPWDKTAVITKDGLLNCNVIETIELRPEAEELEFQSDQLPLEFPHAENQTVSNLIEQTPCSQCHKNKPIMKNYHTWDKFYGSDDDTLVFGSSEEKHYRAFYENMSPSDKSLFIWPNEVIQRVGYQNFQQLVRKTVNEPNEIQKRAATIYYKFLSDLPLEKYVSLPPYQNAPVPAQQTIILRPNLRLGKKLNDMLAHRNYNKIKNRKYFDIEKYLIAISGCDESILNSLKLDRLPLELRSKFSRSLLRQNLNEDEAVGLFEVPSSETNFSNLKEEFFDGDFFNKTLTLRYIYSSDQTLSKFVIYNPPDGESFDALYFPRMHSRHIPGLFPGRFMLTMANEKVKLCPLIRKQLLSFGI